jgi:hypothetical protein
MLTMQLFHDSLFEETDTADTYMESLAKLAQASLDQLDALFDDLAWFTWEAAIE